jgi:hypothetical protein
LCLQHVEWGIPTPQDPQMKRWVDLMARHGGVPTITYGPAFFQWLRDQLVMIEDYAYVRTDFHGDPDLALPEGSQWGDIGKKEFFIICFFFILIMKFLNGMFLRLIKNSQQCRRSTLQASEIITDPETWRDRCSGRSRGSN